MLTNEDRARSDPSPERGAPLFPSFFLGGFECSTHRLRTGRRLDVIAASRHDEFAIQDYERLRRAGLRAARDGLRWHLIESRPGRYDFASARPLVEAARATGTLVVWDLCHYGWPDDLDIDQPAFVRRFVQFAKATARWLKSELDAPPYFTLINEISFFAWAGGDEACLNPYSHGRSFELKAQLARASIEATAAIREVLPEARFASVDPVIHIVPQAVHPEDGPAAEGHRLAQFQAWDMLAGRLWPQLGGSEDLLDLVGVNFYGTNEWFHRGRTIHRDEPAYRPFSEILREVHQRYHRPIFVAETGCEDEPRPAWFRYVCDEVAAAMRAGVPVQGICLYPIVNHPGWDDDRHCHNGLWDYADARGNRPFYEPLAAELRRQQDRFESKDRDGSLLKPSERTRCTTASAAAPTGE